MIKTFLPTTTLYELPIIQTIHCARTVFLVIVQTLATYHTAKADQWEQLFTDGTSRRQVALQDLIISIEEDKLFKWVFKITFSLLLQWSSCTNEMVTKHWQSTVTYFKLHSSWRWKVRDWMQLYLRYPAGKVFSLRSVEVCSWNHVRIKPWHSLGGRNTHFKIWRRCHQHRYLWLRP